MEEKKVQKRAIESREKLLTAGWRLFCEKGYFNTTTKEIAKTAGVSVGNYYNYYKDKFDIYYELAVRYVSGSIKAVDELENELVQAENPREVIGDYITIQMSRAADIGRFFSDCGVLIQDYEKLQKLFLDDTNTMIQTIEKILRKIPSVKKRASYPVMARLLFTMIDEIANDLCRVRGSEIYDEYQEQLIQTVQNYIFGEE